MHMFCALLCFVDQFYPYTLESCYDAQFVVTNSTTDCHDDNLQHSQWRQIWHHENCQFSDVISLAQG